MKKLLVVIFFIGLIFPNGIFSKPYFGIEDNEGPIYLSDYQFVDNTLIFSLTTVGIVAIDLESSEYLGVYNDPATFDESFNFDFEVSGDRIFTTRSKIFDRNSFEILGTYYDTTLTSISIVGEYIMAFNTMSEFIKIDKNTLEVVDKREINFNNYTYCTFENGTLICKDYDNNFKIIDKDFKETSFHINSEITEFENKGNYIIAYNNSNIIKIFDFSGKNVFTIYENLDSDIYIDENSNYSYIHKDKSNNQLTVFQGNFKSGSKNKHKLNYSGQFPYTFEILGMYKDYYILYELDTRQLIKFNNNFTKSEILSKFNGHLQKVKRIENNIYQFAFLEQTPGGIKLKLLDTLNNRENSYHFQSQLDKIFHPIYNFTIEGDLVFIPVIYLDKYSIAVVNMKTGNYSFFGDFDNIITSIHVEANENRIYITEIEEYRYIYNLSDYNLIKKINYSAREHVQISKIDGKMYVLAKSNFDLVFIDFNNNEYFTEPFADSRWRYGYQYCITQDNKYFVGHNSTKLVVHDLVNKKQFKKFEVDMDVNEITSIAATNDLSLIVIGTEYNGLFEYYPETNELIESAQNKILPRYKGTSTVYYNRISDIVLDSKNNKYYFISEDLIFAGDSIKSIISSVIKNKNNIRTITIKGGILDLELCTCSSDLTIFNLNGQRINYHSLSGNKIKIESEDNLFIISYKNGKEIKNYKIINEEN